MNYVNRFHFLIFLFFFEKNVSEAPLALTRFYTFFINPVLKWNAFIKTLDLGGEWILCILTQMQPALVNMKQ